MKQVWRSISMTSMARFWSAGCALLLLALTARVLGPDGRGIIAASTAWILLYSTVAFLSLGQVALHHAAQSRGHSWLPSVLGTLLALTVVLSLSGWVVVGLTYFATEGDLYRPLDALTVALTFIALPLFIWEQYGSALLMGINRLDIYNRAVVLGRGLTLLLAVCLLVFGLGVPGVLVAIIAGQAVVALRGIRHLVAVAEHRPRVTRSAASTLLGGGVRLHANAIGAFLLTATDALIIGHFRGATETGIYQLSTAIITGILIIPQAAAWVLYGRISESGSTAAWGEHRRVLLVVSVITGAVGLVVAAVSPFLIPLIFGSAFEKSVGLLQLLVLALPGLVFSAALAPQWVTRGLFLQVSAITVGLGVANLIGNLALVPSHGAYGSAWSTLTVSVGLLVVNGWMAIHCEREWRKNGYDSLAEPPS
jgi:O-antigen/teichoic acid export membrane protein